MGFNDFEEGEDFMVNVRPYLCPGALLWQDCETDLIVIESDPYDLAE